MKKIIKINVIYVLREILNIVACKNKDSVGNHKDKGDF